MREKKKKRVSRKRIIKKSRRNRSMFIAIALCPMIALLMMVALFVYGELQGIQSTYNIDDESIDSPYNIFDRVLLLNSYTKYDFMDLQDKSMRKPKDFLNEKFLNRENEKLKDKYSFLAVIVDGKFTFFGDESCYDSVYQGLLQENNNESGENAKYYGTGKNRFLFKKLGFNLPDGTSGSACIVTKMDVNLPHITIFTVGLFVMVIVVCILVIIAIIGYAYYNIVIPIRNLQMAVIQISNGQLDEELAIEEDNEFTELYQEFNSMRLVLRDSIEERNKSDALTKEVIGNVSHDLKTPLTAIKGYAEGILDGVAASPERIHKYVRTIHAKAVDMASLVDELSYFTKIYQNEEKFKFSRVNVNRFFSECVSDFALDMETRGIQLLYQCFVAEETEVWLDEEKIKRVIANIIGNAVKYIYRTDGFILITLSEDDDEISVRIRDNGKGIGEDELPHIFDRFYRTDSSRNSSTGGSGLGLAIAKKIVDEHKGRIWAESVVDKGTSIYFVISKSNEITVEEDENE